MSPAPADVIAQVRALAPEGVHHVVEVAFEANIDMDEQVLAVGGSIAAYAPLPTGMRMPARGAG